MDTESESPVKIYVTLDHSLGQLRLDPSRAGQPVVGADLYPDAVAAVRDLGDRGFEVEVLAPQVDQPEIAAALSDAMPGVASVLPAAAFAKTLATLADRPDMATRPAIFVGADRVHRGEAAQRGFTALPHVTLVSAALQQEPLRFILITGSRSDIESLPNLLPYHLERLPDGQWTCLAVAPPATLAGAVLKRLRVEVLCLDVCLEDPLFVQLDDADLTAVEAFAGMRILAADGHRVLVALGPNQSTDELPIHGAHGHFDLLVPSPELLRPAPAPAVTAGAAAWAARIRATQGVSLIPIDTPCAFAPGEQALSPCPTTATEYAAVVDRFSGASDPGGGAIVSRHAVHPHNLRAVELLLTELRDMGYCAVTHPFVYGGRTLHNVIADLPGAGVARLEPDVREQARQKLLAAPMVPGVSNDPTALDAPSHLREAAMLLGLETDADLIADGPGRRRAEVEDAAGLSPWQAWWLSDCPLPGIGAELVLVGCHLDSTAQADGGFDPATDRAPGADDDASGIAAVLSLARHLSPLKGMLTHTVRFCFFNAEEAGLVGSKAYAITMKATGAPIRAVICMDMIGFNNDANRLFEIHAGFPDPVVRDHSEPIAQRVAAAALSLGALAPAQIYRGTMPGGPTDRDRDKFDGAIGRSDHAAFHAQGYPAVVVTEDLFVNRSTEPGFDPNPNYHSVRDTVIDAVFAADIVCAVGQAVRELAM